MKRLVLQFSNVYDGLVERMRRIKGDADAVAVKAYQDKGPAQKAAAKTPPKVSSPSKGASIQGNDKVDVYPQARGRMY